MKILNPIGQLDKNRGNRLATVTSMAGIRIAVLTNKWKSMDRIAARISERAAEVYAAAKVNVFAIPINGPMSAAVEKSVIDDCDVAIVGLAN